MRIGRGRRRVYPWWAQSLTAVTPRGLSSTYLGPVAAGRQPQASPPAHVHGWSLFLGFLALPLQAGRITARTLRRHRGLGRASLALAAATVFTGLPVLSVRLQETLAGEAGQAMNRAVAAFAGVFGVLY